MCDHLLRLSTFRDTISINVIDLPVSLSAPTAQRDMQWIGMPLLLLLSAFLQAITMPRFVLRRQETPTSGLSQRHFSHMNLASKTSSGVPRRLPSLPHALLIEPFGCGTSDPRIAKALRPSVLRMTLTSMASAGTGQHRIYSSVETMRGKLKCGIFAISDSHSRFHSFSGPKDLRSLIFL